MLRRRPGNDAWPLARSSNRGRVFVAAFSAERASGTAATADEFSRLAATFVRAKGMLSPRRLQTTIWRKPERVSTGLQCNGVRSPRYDTVVGLLSHIAAGRETSSDCKVHPRSPPHKVREQTIDRSARAGSIWDDTLRQSSKQTRSSCKNLKTLPRWPPLTLRSRRWLNSRRRLRLLLDLLLIDCQLLNKSP